MDDFEVRKRGFSDDGEDITDTKMFTIEVYKLDKRTKSGRRLLDKYDHQAETYVTHKNHLTGAEYQERYDTPHYCSPSSESYWSM